MWRWDNDQDYGYYYVIVQVEPTAVRFKDDEEELEVTYQEGEGVEIVCFVENVQPEPEVTLDFGQQVHKYGWMTWEMTACRNAFSSFPFSPSPKQAAAGLESPTPPWPASSTPLTPTTATMNCSSPTRPCSTTTPW